MEHCQKNSINNDAVRRLVHIVSRMLRTRGTHWPERPTPPSERARKQHHEPVTTSTKLFHWKLSRRAVGRVVSVEDDSFLEIMPDSRAPYRNSSKWGTPRSPR